MKPNAQVPPLGSEIAVVGAGISGLASAYFLSRGYRVTLYESEASLGGHSNTVDVSLDGQTHPVDTGFLVFNDKTYPNLIRLFSDLGVASHASDMSFSVSVDNGRLEWAGTSLNTLFAQRRRILLPSFHRMVLDILRFNRQAPHNLTYALEHGISLATLLNQGGYGENFKQNYLLPMAAAIWSSSPADILNFPAATFLQFCINHGLLQVNDRPQWRTVQNGSRQYVQRISRSIGAIRTGTPVRSITRGDGQVQVATDNGTTSYKAVVLATHAPVSRHLLSDLSPLEDSLLAGVRYQPNCAVLHTDTALLPRCRRVWSAWNYLRNSTGDAAQPACVSYLINKLQPLPFSTSVIVTLNPDRPIRPGSEIARFDYEHPVLDAPAVAAQQRIDQIQGHGNTWFAGAWTGYGFHEDGLKSALRVVRNFNLLPEWAQL